MPEDDDTRGTGIPACAPFALSPTPADPNSMLSPAPKPEPFEISLQLQARFLRQNHQ